MTVSDLISDAYAEYKGKASKAPVANSDKWNDALAIANSRLRRWAKDPNNRWHSLFEVRSQGTISSALVYDLDDELIDLSDFIYITVSDTQEQRFAVIKPHQRKLYNFSVYLSGEDPKTLTFADSPMNTTYIGGKLNVPAFWMPEELTTANSLVPEQAYDWMVLELAASLARNDPAKDDQYTNLKGEANSAYGEMAAKNQNSATGFPAAAGYTFNDLGESW